MRDGRTVKREHARTPGLGEFLQAWEATLVILSGPGAGVEHPLERPRTVLGRGPGVDLALPDPEMSRQHAAVEFEGGSFRIRDLGSTNGTQVNGTLIHAAELKHGDRIATGGHVVQFLLERQPERPKTWVVADA
jgi:pSer/pThr/pTyr-binding forkhead associated (FHA) protein